MPSKPHGHITRQERCRLCGGNNFVLIVHLTPTPLAHQYVTAECLGEVQETYPLELFLCLGCGHTAMLDVVSPDVLWADATQVTSRSLGLTKSLRQEVEALLALASPLHDSLIVDIGSNDGTFLKFFQERDLRVLGIEPSSYTAAMARASGIPTIQNYFTRNLAKTIKKEWGQARIITANRVIANVTDLADMTAGIHDLLEPEGVFVFETGYLADMLESGLFETVYHEHIGYDSVRPLDAFFRSHEMQLLYVERIPLKGGTLRGVVQRTDGPRTVSPTVSSFIALEETAGLQSVESFKAFTKRIDTTKSDLSKLLSEIEARGATIAGYGAAQASTTIIFHFGLGTRLTFLVDENPASQNLFSPGYHIPVLAPQSIYERRPDYVVILAYRYAEHIIGQHQAYLDQGGRFIIPIPEVKVI